MSNKTGGDTMYILTECRTCGFVWSTLALALECERIDHRRVEMKTEGEKNLTEHYRVEKKYFTDYPE